MEGRPALGALAPVRCGERADRLDDGTAFVAGLAPSAWASNRRCSGRAEPASFTSPWVNGADRKWVCESRVPTLGQRGTRLTGSCRRPWSPQSMLSRSLRMGNSTSERRSWPIWRERDLPPPHGNRRAPDYYANAGKVIETLRADYPCVFERDPDFDIYAPNILLVDRTSGNALQGKRAYAAVFWVLRMHGRLLFSERTIEITSLFHDDRDGTIYVRWRMCGRLRRWASLFGLGMVENMARHGQRLSNWQEGAQLESETRLRQVEGYSTYRLNMHGWVYEHALDNIEHTRIRLRPLVESILGFGTLEHLERRVPVATLQMHNSLDWFVEFVRGQRALCGLPPAHWTAAGAGPPAASLSALDVDTALWNALEQEVRERQGRQQALPEDKQVWKGAGGEDPAGV
ncbi:hypothetical protein CDCA_CDCA06G1810 [Cyanidium caldarium]|uniref:Uncharacterized protein n=1 Tax=Cyanidium caldarium TaxID=2771 RepID=A0AAV9IUJ1_CYACA|nr:hypothetical protein CDCA_CDCA06G1810 [Cyanidium caldarium]